MTEPVRPLEALMSLVKQWREYADRQSAIYASGIYVCADELSALLQAAAPPAPTAELSELKQKVTTMRIAAQERIRDDAWRWPHVQPNVLESVIGAIGEISVVEAREGLARLESEAAPPAPTAERQVAELEWVLKRAEEIVGYEHGRDAAYAFTQAWGELPKELSAAPPERVSEGKPWCQICGVELTGFYCDTCHAALVDSTSGPAVEPREEPVEHK